MLQADAIPAEQQFTEQIPVPRLAGYDEEVTEKAADLVRSEPLRQGLPSAAETRSEEYDVGDGIDGGIGNQGRRRNFAHDRLGADIGSGRERVPDPGPVK